MAASTAHSDAAGRTAGELRVCSSCGQTRPKKWFRPIRRGSSKLRRECRRCAADRRRRDEARRRERQISQISSRINSQPDRIALIALAGELKLRFGGSAGAAEAFLEAVEEAKNSGRTATACRVMSAIAILLACADEEEAVHLRQLSDDEIRRRMMDSLADLVESEPQIAVRALRAAGYSITPPKEPSE